jgi:hypothetical protein
MIKSILGVCQSRMIALALVDADGSAKEDELLALVAVVASARWALATVATE